MPTIGAGDLILLRSHPHETRLGLIIHQPTELFHARVQALPGDATATLAYTLGDAAGVQLLSGMTVLIGSTFGGHERRILRLRDDHITAAPGNGTLPIAESSDLHSGAIAINDHITVLEEWRIWPVYPRMVEVGGVISWWKDYNDAWPGAAASLPPVAIAGPPAVQFLNGGPVNVNYDGSDSYAVYPGAAIPGGSHAWVFDGGNPPNSAVMTPGAVSYAAASGLAGHRVTYAVTDSNIVTQPTYRHAFILDREGANAPIYDFTLESCRGSFDSGGWAASIRVYGVAAAMANIRPGTMVILFAEDWYAGTAGSIGPLPAAQAPRNNLVFVGWAVEDSIRQDPETGDVLFEAENATASMRRMEMYPISCEDSAAPAEWYQVRDLTVNRALRHYYGWHSTLYLVCDVFRAGTWKATAGTAGDERIKAWDGAEGNLYSVGDQFLRDAIVGRVLGDRMSRVRPEMDVLMQAVAGTQIFPADNRDWRTEIEIPEPEEAESKQVDLSGTDWDGAAGLPYFSRAPGLVSKYRGVGYRNERFAVASQAQLNEVSGDILASLNNPYPGLRFPLAGNWRIFDICPQEYFTLAQVTVRDTFVHPDDKFVPREVAIEHDAEHGSMAVDLVACYKTDGQDGVTILYPDTPPTGDGSGSPPAGYSGGGGGGGDGGGDIVYALTGSGLYRGTNLVNDLAAASVWANISPNNPASGEALWNFMVDPFNADVAYVIGDANGAGNAALWRTTNLTAASPSWTVLLTGADLTAAGVTEQTLYRIHGSKTMAGYLVAYGRDVATLDVIIGHSHDRGNTWTWINLAAQCGLLQAWVDGGLAGLEVSDYSQLVLIGVNECLLPPPINQWYTSIYHSYDHGHTWSLFYRFAGMGATDPVYSLQLPEPGNVNDQIVLCSTQFGGAGPPTTVWQSVDGGTAFTDIQPGIGPGYSTISNILECDPFNGRRYHFFADINPATRQYLFLSTDAGASFAGVATLLPICPYHFGTGGHYPGSAIYYLGGGWPGVFFYVSVDSGATWNDRTGNFAFVFQGGAQRTIRIIPLVPVGTWGG